MKSFTSILCLLGLFLFGADAQAQAQSPAEVWPILQRPGRLLKADSKSHDDQGWTHYFNASEGVLLLSVYTDGQDIGDPEEQLSVRVGLLGNYGHGAHDLSAADYIENSIWYTPNRYWKIDGALPISKPIRVRHYFDQTDLDDLRRGLSEQSLSFNQPEELVYYAIQGYSTHPFSPRIRRAGADIRFHEHLSSVGQYGSYYYAELELNHATASGSFGFKVPLTKKRLQVDGQIRRLDGSPVEDAFLRSATGEAVVRSGENGTYSLGNLQAGQAFLLAPYVAGREAEGVGILDLIALERHLSGLEPIHDPYRLLAADLNSDGQVDRQDMAILQELVHYGSYPFQGQGGGWRFIPADYKFPASGDFLQPEPPSSIRLERLLNDMAGADFWAVKLGDLLFESEFLNTPPVVVDPVFEFPTLRSCGAGELVEVDLTVRDFHGLRGVQFTIEWDSAALELLSIRDMELPGLTEEQFGKKKAPSGKLSLSWYSPEPLKKKHLPDGTRICRLVFRAHAQSGSCSLRFSDRLSPVQVLNNNLSQGNALFVLGKVEIENPSTLEIIKAQITLPRCEGDEGQIDIDVAGGKGPYQFQWNHGATTKELSGLAPGVYQVQVSDGVQCPILSQTFVLESPSAMRIINEHIRQVSCPGLHDGAINFKIEGGTPPFKYKWSNSSATPWIGNLTSGQYGITITDAAGCELKRSFVVEASPMPLVSYGITPASPSGKSNGALTVLELMERPGPYSYIWNTGHTGPSVQRLPPGLYEVTISDAAGCRFSLPLQLDAAELPENLDVVLLKEILNINSMSFLRIDSPASQAVQVKFFDTRSNLVYQQVIAVVAGSNHLYLQPPSREGTYIVQFSAPKGGVRSVRCEVR